jgi:AAA domain
MDSVPPDPTDDENPFVTNDKMERIRDAVLAKLGGWNHRDWVGRYDYTCPEWDPKHKQNRGLIRFCDAFELGHPYEPSPISEAAEGVASRGENEDEPSNSELWQEFYKNDTERFVGIPHRALFDHAGPHEFALDDRPDGVVVAFPYVMALREYVAKLPVLVGDLRKRGMQVRCIAHGWWNAWTVGLVYYPRGSGFETRVPGFVAPTPGPSQTNSLPTLSHFETLRTGGPGDVQRLIDEAPTDGWYVVPEPATLPRREWLMRPSYMRKTVSMLGAPGAAGKSTLMLVEALSLTSGRRLLHGRVPERHFRVCMFNAEESAAELDLRIAAAMLIHGLLPQDIEGRLLILPETSRITLVRPSRRGGAEIVDDAVDTLVELLKGRKIDVLMLDPLAMLHHADENSNSDMTLFMEALLRIAREANVAIRIAHHTKKMGGERAGIEAFRGATALINNSRQGDVINGASAEEAAKLSIPSNDRSRFFSLGNLKFNYGPRESDDWFEIVAVPLPNGETVATVKQWNPPTLKLEYSTAAKIYAMVSGAEKTFRGDQRSPGWLGWQIATLLKVEGWEDKSPAAKRFATLWLRALTNAGVVVETLITEGGKERPAYEAGHLPTQEEWG